MSSRKRGIFEKVFIGAFVAAFAFALFALVTLFEHWRASIWADEFKKQGVEHAVPR